jgi:predicted ATP-grasp superfamily ATP-dependent carboligase
MKMLERQRPSRVAHRASGSKPTVLVTGSEAPAGLAAVRALDQAGFEVWAAVESRAALGARSRAPAGLVDVGDPGADPDGFVARLAAGAERVGAAAVLPGSEQSLLAMTGREGAFADSVVVGTPSDEKVLSYAMDKIALGLLSVRAGLDMPHTSVLTAGESADSVGLTFPAMVKPFRSELTADGVLQRFSSERVETQAQLDAALRVLPDGSGVVQPCIDGRLISVNGVFFGGKLYAANQHEVHRVWPYLAGHATYAETFPMWPERERKVAAFMEELGWSGVFNLQLIERDGRDYVIDLNPRFYVSLTLAVAAGLNLPAIWASLLLGLPFETHGYRSGVRFREETGDTLAILAALRRGELRALRGAVPRPRTAHALFSKEDPRPGLQLVDDLAAAVRRRVRP